MRKIKGPRGEEVEPQANQRRDEPLPASRHDDRDRLAVLRNQQQQPGADAARPQGAPSGAGDAAAPDKPPEPDNPAEPDDPAGKAIRDMMPGPRPQGDVPDAPAVQVAAAETENGRPARVRSVGNAVPGKPDGEVDTRS